MDSVETNTGRWFHAIVPRLPLFFLVAAWITLLGFGDVFRGASCLLMYVTLERQSR